MTFNRQFKGLHLAGGNVDWVLKQHVERDICLLFHQLSNFSDIMGDLYYGSVFGLPYWEYLDFPGIEEIERNFVRDGCLVMILAMSWDQIDGSGSYIKPFISACREAVSRLSTVDEDTSRLVRTVRLALDLAERGGPDSLELQELSGWVHKRYVRDYFRDAGREFDTNEYFKG